MIIRNARILTFNAANRVIDRGMVEVCADGSIGAVKRDTGTTVQGEADVIDGGGKLLMPALINTHTHLYSTLARGITLQGAAPRNFPEILKKLWWKLDAALDEEDVYYSALVGLIDSAKAGVATLIDHHSSPGAVAGSLDAIEHAFREVGMRGALCYETSDRNGATDARAGIAENVRFLEHVRGNGGGAPVKGMFGLHAQFTLSDRTLAQCLEANRSLGAGFHVHVAEDKSDVAAAERRCGKTPVERLCDLGVLDDRAIAAHCIHVNGADVARLAKRHVNVAHNPQSNCNNAVGTANICELMRRGVMVGLGSDGYTPRLWEEFMAAFHQQKVRAGDPRVGYAEAYAAVMLNNRAIVKKLFGWELGRIERGARADLMLLDYYPPTPVTPENLFGHLLFGIAHSAVDSLLVNGRFVVRDHRCVTVDERAIAERAAVRAKRLWARV